jgi:hypothetical protein
MDTNMFTTAGLCLVIVVLLALIAKILYNRAHGRDDLDGLL